MSAAPDEPAPPGRVRPGAARRAFPWLVLGVVAAVLFESFAHPLLAASVFCLKFAHADFRTAGWLLRADTDRPRGRTVALLYVAAGLWKATTINYALLTAAVLFSLATGLPAWPQPAPGIPAPNFGADGLFPWLVPALGGFLVTVVAGLAAYARAYRRGLPLWLGPAAHAARESGRWPPVGGGNWLWFRPAVTATGIPVALMLIGLIPRLFPVPPAVNAGAWNTGLTIHLLFGVMLALLPMGLSGSLMERDGPDLLARTPAECWGG